MLKRSLIAVAALLMLAGAVQAGEIKTHNWPCEFIYQEITQIPVTMDIGFWVRIKDQNKLGIKLSQKEGSVHDFAGCTNMVVETNFAITLKCSITATGAVGGKYSCSVDPAEVQPPGATVKVCAELKDADLGAQAGGTKNVKVANVKILVKPL